MLSLLAFALLQGLPEPLERPLAELKSPSKPRRETALFALKAFGRIAIERLVKEKADRAILDALQGISLADRVLLNELEEKTISLSLEETPYFEALREVGKAARVEVITPDYGESVDRVAELKVTLKEKAITPAAALRRICKPVESTCSLAAAGERRVRITQLPEDSPEARAPVRIIGDPATVPSLIEALGNDSIEERDLATRELRRLEFTAEDALWTALEDPRAEVRSRANSLLRRLYGERTVSPVKDAVDRLSSTRITVEAKDKRLCEVIDQIARSVKMSLIIDTNAIPDAGEARVSTRIAEVSANTVLVLLLRPRDYDYLVFHDTIFVTVRPGHFFRDRSEILWTDPALATIFEQLISDLSSPDLSRQKRSARELADLGRRALEPLRHAVLIHSEEKGRCFADVRRKIAAAAGDWLSDQHPGAYRQGLSERQIALLWGKTEGKASNRSLQETVNSLGAKSICKIGAGTPQFVSLRGETLYTALRLMTGPHGLDFYMDGETVIIDTATNVKAALDQK
jgi:hypothetical protein